MLKRPLRFLTSTDGSVQTRALRSGVWVAFAGSASFVIVFVRGIVLARLLSPEVFGLMAICLIATRFLDVFTETGFGAALVQRQGPFEEARDTSFTLSIFRAIGLAVVVYFVAPLAAAFYGESILTPVLRLAGLTFILRGFYNPNTLLLQKNLQFQRLTLIDMANMVSDLVVSVALAYWLRSVWALVIAQVVAAGVNSLLSFLVVGGRVRFRLDFDVAKELYQYGRFITGTAVVLFLTRELDSALIGRQLGMESLGYYTVAFSLANLPSTFLAKLLSRVLFPLFSQLQNQHEALRAEYLRGMKLVSTLAVPASAATIVLAPEIIDTLYGPKWSIAASVLRVLAIFGCFRAIGMLNGYLYNAIGKPHVGFFIGVGRLVALGILLWPMTARYGLVGASIAVTLPMVVQYLIGLFMAKRYIAVDVTAQLGSLAGASAQAAFICAAIIATKLLTRDAVSPWVLLAAGGATILLLNRSSIQVLLKPQSTS